MIGGYAVSKQNEDIELIDEIIENVNGLQLEYQEFFLEIAKGMAFTKSCLNKQIDGETDKPKTA
jgi:hypothetical protein